MKNLKKVFAMILCLSIIVSTSVPVLAEASSSNMTMVVSKSTVNVGETVTVSLSTKGMTVAGFGGFVKFDPTFFQCKSAVGFDPEYPDDIGINKVSGKSSWTEVKIPGALEKSNDSGNYGFGTVSSADVEYVADANFITLTFEAIKAGSGRYP